MYLAVIRLITYSSCYHQNVPNTTAYNNHHHSTVHFAISTLSFVCTLINVTSTSAKCTGCSAMQQLNTDCARAHVLGIKANCTGGVRYMSQVTSMFLQALRESAERQVVKFRVCPADRSHGTHGKRKIPHGIWHLLHVCCY